LPTRRTSENMKSVILALLVVLVVSHSEALTCNCSASSMCSGSIHNCSGSDQVCIYFMFKIPALGYFKRCIGAVPQWRSFFVAGKLGCSISVQFFPPED
ncbi:unnamed protein product, partial [Pleuronectes platessa]